MTRRVLTLSWEYPPVVEGGLARHVHRLSEALVRAGDRVDVLTRGLAGVPPAVEVRGGVRVHRAPEPPKPADVRAFVRWIARMNRDLAAAGAALPRPDVVHGHDWLVGRAAARLADAHGVPLVVTIHATEHGRHGGWVGRRPQRTIHELERALARRADRVLVCSRFMAEHVAAVFGVEAEVVPNGVDAADLGAPSADLPALRGRFAAPGEHLVLLAGRLVHEKGFQDALDALAAVGRRVAGVRFVVAGAGPHRGELERQAAALGLDGRGTFLGWAGDEVLHGLYRVADVCVVPSRYEPSGLVPLEAMACGCPVIAADVGGLREVVPARTGLRFAPADAAGLARVLEWSLTNPALRLRLREEARRHVRGFGWDGVARRTRAVHGAVSGAPEAPGARGHVG